MDKPRDVGHFLQPHVGPHGNDAGENVTRIGILLDVAVQHMGEAAQEAGFLGNEPQEFFDVDARQLAVERAVDRFVIGRIDQCPTPLIADAGDLDVLVAAVLDALVDGIKSRFDLIA